MASSGHRLEQRRLSQMDRPLPGGSARSDPSLARSLRSALERLQTTELLDWQVRVETDAGRNAVPANVRFAAGSRRRSWHIPDLRRTAAIWPNADLQAARVRADFDPNRTAEQFDLLPSVPSSYEALVL